MTNMATVSLELRQPSLATLCPVIEAVSALANDGGIEERGAIFTKREVVEFILDLVGYTSNKQLCRLSLLEPSFGAGDFLIPAIERLMKSWLNRKNRKLGHEALRPAIRAVELHRATYLRTRGRVIELLKQHDLPSDVAISLVDSWLTNADFLLCKLPYRFDVVVGNPPYVRQELIPNVLLQEYRSRYTTLYDRADLYVPFIERSLRLLNAGGSLGFICADRWMKNRYGGPLRALVAEQYHLRVYVDMTDTPAFHSDVIAYPAITIIDQGRSQTPTRISARPEISASALRTLSRSLCAKIPGKGADGIREISSVVIGSEPWLFDTSDQMALIRRLEACLPTIEQAGCKVGIGVATGADQAYIAPYDTLDVEPDRKLPLVMTRDIISGRVQWNGLGVVNPFSDAGGLVPLSEFPLLRTHLEARRDQIAGRHCAQKIPANWYRTIDRITPSLAARPKLLIPDIKGEAQVVYEDGRLYPHHNLYYVISDDWDLHALQAVLLSGIARLFVAAYSTKMRGGYLRFQAQYLRRIRVPRWSAVSNDLRTRLAEAARTLNMQACNEAAAELYGLSPSERSIVAAP